MPDNPQPKPIFYSKRLLFIVSVFSIFVGALLFTDNLFAAGKKRKYPFIAIFILAAPLIIRWSLHLGAIYVGSYMIPHWFGYFLVNFVSGVLLIGPIWNYFLSDFKEYENRPLWGPLAPAKLLVIILIITITFSILVWA